MFDVFYLADMLVVWTLLGHDTKPYCPGMALISTAVPKEAINGLAWAALAGNHHPPMDSHIRNDVTHHAGLFLARAAAVAYTNQEDTRRIQTNRAVPAVQVHHLT